MLASGDVCQIEYQFVLVQHHVCFHPLYCALLFSHNQRFSLSQSLLASIDISRVSCSCTRFFVEYWLYLFVRLSKVRAHVYKYMYAYMNYCSRV